MIIRDLTSGTSNPAFHPGSSQVQALPERFNVWPLDSPIWSTR